MIKYRNISVTNPYEASQKPVRICDGGLGSSSIEEAIENLNTIKKTDLGQPGGIPVLGEDGKVKLTDFSQESFIVTYLSSLAKVTPGATTELQISNYDDFLEYECSISAGSVTRRGKTLIVVLPEGYSEETVDLSINGFDITLYVNLPIVDRISFMNLNEGDMVKRTDTILFSEFSVSYAKGDEICESIDIQVSRDKGFEDIVVEDLGYTTNRDRYVLHGLEIESEYYIRARYNSSTDIKTQWSIPVSFRTRSSYVANPVITNPSNNDNTVYPYDLTFTTEAFTVVDGTDTHASTTWEVATDNSFSYTSLAKQITADTTNKTSLRVTDLLPSMTYYVRCKFKGTNIEEWSNWSDVVTFSTPAYRTDASGRRFLRHSSNMGTIMSWVDKTGRRHNTLVLDASYRKLLYWGSSRTDLGISNLTNVYYINSSNYSTFHSGTKTSLATYFNAMTDTYINAISNYQEDSGTSNSNTTLMYNNSGTSTSYAPGYCRSVKVGDDGCDLPNIQTLIRIYCSMFMLDDMDPTANGNRFLFSKERSTNSYNWYFNNSQPYAWSSTEYNANYAQTINYQGYIHYHNSSFYKNSYQFAVIPVLEV